MKVLIFCVTLLCLCLFAKADNFVVLTSGSQYFWNYRHQADIFHAYQIFKKNGIPVENIITLANNDVLTDPLNPVQGKMFNRPSSGPGFDVYAGVKLDYTGDDVTPQNFLAVLRGDSVTTKGKKVLQSTSEDNVFIYFVDHGGYGLLCFPDDDLYADELLSTLKYMHENNLYKKMVIYIEACESGSMFEGLFPDDWNIYVTTASDPWESSWATYCNPDNVVNGVSLKTCIGDLYSVSFLENLETIDPFSQTLETQFEIIKKRTTKSHPQQYGQLSFLSDTVGSFEAYGSSKRNDTIPPLEEIAHSQIIDSRLMKLAFLLNQHQEFKNENTDAELRAEIESMKRHDSIFSELKKRLNIDMNAPAGEINFQCLRERMESYKIICGRLSEYGLKYVKYIHYSCLQNTDFYEFESILDKQCQQIEI